MNINEIDFSKIQVVSTTKERQSEYQFPEEGWFVGATNGTFGPDHFEAEYLYEPCWSTHESNSWGGHTFKDKSGELKCWWTFNSCFSNIEKSFLYACQDEETARLLADLLNSIPTKSILRLNQAILDLDKKIQLLQQRKKDMITLKEYVENLTC